MNQMPEMELRRNTSNRNEAFTFTEGECALALTPIDFCPHNSNNNNYEASEFNNVNRSLVPIRLLPFRIYNNNELYFITEAPAFQQTAHRQFFIICRFRQIDGCSCCCYLEIIELMVVYRGNSHYKHLSSSPLGQPFSRNVFFFYFSLSSICSALPLCIHSLVVDFVVVVVFIVYHFGALLFLSLYFSICHLIMSKLDLWCGKLSFILGHVCCSCCCCSNAQRLSANVLLLLLLNDD